MDLNLITTEVKKLQYMGFHCNDPKVLPIVTKYIIVHDAYYGKSVSYYNGAPEIVSISLALQFHPLCYNSAYPHFIHI